MLKPVSCDHVTSFNCDGKKARDGGITCFCCCCCCLFYFFAGWYFCFPQDERDGISFVNNISGRGEILSYKGLSRLGLISEITFSEI